MTQSGMKHVGIVGWKNSGKTTMVERLVSIFTMRGVSVSTIKHAHHALDVDTPGRDSFRHRTAGAHEVLVSGANRWALMHELRGAPEPTVDELLAHLAPVDLAIIEGFKRAGHAKVEVHRAETERPPIALTDPTILAIATDTPLPDLRCPVLPLDAPDKVADFIADALDLPALVRG